MSQAAAALVEMSRPSIRMYGEDSSGRKVSLLHEPSPKPTPHQHSIHHRATTFQYPRPASKSHKRRYCTSQVSSPTSTSPENSPSTPPLSRMNSISSVGTCQTPSPMTPEYPFDPLDQSKNGLPYYSTYPRPNASTYPAMPQSHEPSAPPYFQFPNPRLTAAQMDEALAGLNQPSLQPVPAQTRYSDTTGPSLSIPPSNGLPQVAPPSSTPEPAATTEKPASPSSASKPAKKKYPCPHAQRYQCTDTFTTSGHAARHGKKHTGEKNIHCPTCSKAFTRKDNMKQHERTHRASKAENSSPTIAAAGVTKASASSRPRRPAPTSAGTQSPPIQHLDAPVMEFDGDSSKLDLSGQLRLAADAMQDIRPSANGRIPSFSGRSEVDGEGDSPGLDALAHASEMVQ